MVISAACAGVLLHTASAAMRARLTTFVRSMTSSRCFWCCLLYEIRLINPLPRHAPSAYALRAFRHCEGHGPDDDQRPRELRYELRKDVGVFNRVPREKAVTLAKIVVDAHLPIVHRFMRELSVVSA